MEKMVRFLISLFIVLTFTAIQFPTLATSADLIVKKDTDIGDVLVRQAGAYLYVEYVIADPIKWCMTMTQLALGASLEDIPQTNKGNPVPGRFPYKGIFENGCGAEFTYKINIAGYKSGTTLFIAAHADVRNSKTHKNEDVKHQETHEKDEKEGAWAAGSYFPDGKRATYFTYTVQEIPR